MSDAKPFAEAMSDGDEWYVVIDGIKLGSSCANAICHRAARINAAVARERREAAAEALEWAAKRCRQVIEDMSLKARTAYTDGYLEALRVEAAENAARAAALRMEPS